MNIILKSVSVIRRKNMERFTSQAKEALRLAKEAAIELEHGHVGTEHILM